MKLNRLPSSKPCQQKKSIIGSSLRCSAGKKYFLRGSLGSFSGFFLFNFLWSFRTALQHYPVPPALFLLEFLIFFFIFWGFNLPGTSSYWWYSCLLRALRNRGFLLILSFVLKFWHVVPFPLTRHGGRYRDGHWFPGLTVPTIMTLLSAS